VAPKTWTTSQSVCLGGVFALVDVFEVAVKLLLQVLAVFFAGGTVRDGFNFEGHIGTGGTLPLDWNITQPFRNP